jgi:hypothetical protein
MDMAVVGHVEEQLVEDLVLDPVVKYGDGRREVGNVILKVKLYVYVLKFDRRFFFEYGSQVVAPSSRFRWCRDNGTTGAVPSHWSQHKDLASIFFALKIEPIHSR